MSSERIDSYESSLFVFDYDAALCRIDLARLLEHEVRVRISGFVGIGIFVMPQFFPLRLTFFFQIGNLFRQIALLLEKIICFYPCVRRSPNHFSTVIIPQFCITTLEIRIIEIAYTVSVTY